MKQCTDKGRGDLSSTSSYPDTGLLPFQILLNYTFAAR